MVSSGAAVRFLRPWSTLVVTVFVPEDTVVVVLIVDVVMVVPVMTVVGRVATVTVLHLVSRSSEPLFS